MFQLKLYAFLSFISFIPPRESILNLIKCHSYSHIAFKWRFWKKWNQVKAAATETMIATNSSDF